MNNNKPYLLNNKDKLAKFFANIKKHNKVSRKFLKDNIKKFQLKSLRNYKYNNLYIKKIIQQKNKYNTLNLPYKFINDSNTLNSLKEKFEKESKKINTAKKDIINLLNIYNNKNIPKLHNNQLLYRGLSEKQISQYKV